MPCNFIHYVTSNFLGSINRHKILKLDTTINENKFLVIGGQRQYRKSHRQISPFVQLNFLKEDINKNEVTEIKVTFIECNKEF